MNLDPNEANPPSPTSERIEALDLSGLAPARALDDDEPIAQEEGFFESFDDEKLFWQSWEPDEGAERGVVALMHGFGEHSSRYDHVAGALCRAGYGVMAIDARGHGRSTGRRAHVAQFGHYVQDLDQLVERTAARWPDLPLFCLGHSNGGLIALMYALEKPEDLAGFIVTSPMCRLALKVSAPKAVTGKVLSTVWPTLTMANDIDPKKLSHIDRVVEAYERDPLVLKVVSARWFTEATRAQDELFERAPQLNQPFLFLIGGSDQIVDPSAAEEVFHRMTSGDRQMEVYPRLFHEILNERSWEEVVRRLLDWLEEHRSQAEAKTDEADA
ncbi:MAG: alpha/beta hydrolase [Persicimonas sp.]